MNEVIDDRKRRPFFSIMDGHLLSLTESCNLFRGFRQSGFRGRHIESNWVGLVGHREFHRDFPEFSTFGTRYLIDSDDGAGRSSSMGQDIPLIVALCPITLNDHKYDWEDQ